MLKPLKPKQFGAGRLDPEAERRLIDADEAAGIERDKEEVVPALQHAADGGGVIEVGVAVALEFVEVREGRQQQDQRERLPSSWLPERAQPGEQRAQRETWVARRRRRAWAARYR